MTLNFNTLNRFHSTKKQQNHQWPFFPNSVKFDGLNLAGRHNNFELGMFFIAKNKQLPTGGHVFLSNKKTTSLQQKKRVENGDLLAS